VLKKENKANITKANIHPEQKNITTQKSTKQSSPVAEMGDRSATIDTG